MKRTKKVGPFKSDKGVTWNKPPATQRVKRKDVQMSRDEMLSLTQKAGLLPDEMRDDPEHGLVISASGLRKMAELSPAPERARAFVQTALSAVEAATGWKEPTQ